MRVKSSVARRDTGPRKRSFGDDGAAKSGVVTKQSVEHVTKEETTCFKSVGLCRCPLWRNGEAARKCYLV